MSARSREATLPFGEPHPDEADTQPIPLGAALRVRVTPEALLYVALAALALVLRVGASARWIAPRWMTRKRGRRWLRCAKWTGACQGACSSPTAR